MADAEARLGLEHEFLDCAKSFNWEQVKTMLTATPDLINVQPAGRWTALHQAAFEGNADMCTFLTGKGADVAAQNRRGQKPADVAKNAAAKAAVAAASGAAAASDAADTAAAPVKAEAADASAASPPKKKAKTERCWALNINNAVDKEYEGCSLHELCSAPITAIQGIGPKGTEAMHKLKIKTIKQLGTYKFYKMAKAITILSKTEIAGEREELSILNINSAMDKAHETKSLVDITKLPPSALQGLAGWVDEEFKVLRISTIEQLGEWKFAQWAESIIELAAYENKDMSS